MKKPVNKVVILGGGTAGWMTAAALANSFNQENTDVTLVESDQIGTIGVGEATVPTLLLFNSALRLSEEEFIRETKATFKLGIEFVDWKEKGSRYFHPFGVYGLDMDGVSFTNFWLRWKKSGGHLDYYEFNAESLAARSGKFMRVMNESGPKVMPGVHYAYQFDAGLYARFLRRYSEQRGVKRVEGKLQSVQQNATSGYIETLVLESGQSVEGDLFIDCSGFNALLIEKVMNAGYIDWSHWLPVDSAIAVPCAKSSQPLLPYTRATARGAGWQWRIPLQHRTGNGHVFCSQYMNDEEAKSILMQSLEGEALADPRVIRFKTGARKHCWVKNCIAIGLSSGFLEPLESTSIHLIQRAIFKLLSMFPSDGIIDPLINQFNKEMSEEYDEVKDFLIAHYVTTERDDTEFWRYVKNMSIPDTLRHRLELFKSRGEAMSGANGLFRDVNWFAVLKGQGLEPESYHPIADSISDDELKRRLIKVRSGVENRVNMMPSHTEYLLKNHLISES